MNREVFSRNIQIALEAVQANKLRTLLTALGIIFGVAAVIAMMAIGNGAEKEILDQIKLVGVNNIVIEPVVEQIEEKVSAGQTSNKAEKKLFSPGLNLQTARDITELLPNISEISPEIVLETQVISSGIRRSTKLIGVTPAFFEISDFDLQNGNYFTDEQLEQGLPVCILGSSVAGKFFSNTEPMGKKIKVGNNWLDVIGVLEPKSITEQSLENLGIRNYNMDIYTPIQTMLIRYVNRTKISAEQLEKARREKEEEANITISNYHQIDRLVVQVNESEQLSPTAEVLNRFLKRRHRDVVDYQITIPELLLKQQQRTKEIFNMVLGIIAGISLLVGGIGIMNIMLASVLERIKEIGIRMAIGASKSDIIMQFVLEAIIISISGGLLGVILGISISKLIQQIVEIPTIISISSILISFSVAASVGLVFGILPARKAANMDPITSLRHE